MAANIEELVRVPLDTEIETPTSGYLRLPDVVSFVALFGPQGRMAKVMNETTELLKGVLDVCRCCAKVAPEPVSPSSAHYGPGALGSAPAHAQT
jgi:hypothetical protein